MMKLYPWLSSLLVVSAFALTGCGSGGETGQSEPTTGGGNEVYNPVEEAIRTGKALLVENSRDLVKAELDTIEDNRDKYRQAKISLFNLDANGEVKENGKSLTSITWDPTHDAAQLIAAYGLNEAVLVSNASKNGGEAAQRGFAILGENKSRYLVMGSNPMRNWAHSAGINEEMHQFMQNAVAWLVRRDNYAEKPLKLVFAQLDDSHWFPDATQTRNWFDSRFEGQVSYNVKGDCDGVRLAGCLEAKPDLLVISQNSAKEDVETVSNAVADAMSQGIPVLYMHLDGDLKALGSKLFKLFNVTYEKDNYWDKLYLNAYNSLDHMGILPDKVMKVRTMLNHFLQEDYAFDWSACVEENCSGVNGLYSEFYAGAEEVRRIMNSLDVNKINLFAGSGRRYEKLLALIGDHFRSTVSFPMDKATTDSLTFMKSLYADHAVYNYRSLNPAQANMGNFSRSNFDHVTPISKTINLESKVSFRAAGVYALPGQKVSVTRMDETDVWLGVFVNTQRPGSTHEYQQWGYTRPKFLKTPTFYVGPGETISFTSTYGGPIQIQFGASGRNISLRFSNVGEHPFWRGEEDNDRFERALAEGEYDWAELVTRNFEVHSSLEKMRDSVNNNWKTASALAAGTIRYTHNFPHVLAGFKGPGIDVVPEIHDFATAHGLDIHYIDEVKHVNSDQTTCGGGCAGNPYDTSWSFSPLAHGDLHELGHGLENRRFRFDGWELHASTNPYSYYSKYHFYLDTGKAPECQWLPFENMFNILKESLSKPDPAAYVRDQNLKGWSNGAGIMVQIMMSAQGEGRLKDGWNLLPRMHILERNFSAALGSESSWLAARNKLGFSLFSYDEARSIGNNDWLVMVISYAAGLDVRDYLAMWGLPFTDKASAQVAAYGYPVAPRKYYVSNSDQFCYDLNKPSIPVDGMHSWP